MAANVCECGHPWPAHGFVAGVEMWGCPDLPDVWVCAGARLVAITPDTSPWDCVCGCVLHAAPPVAA